MDIRSEIESWFSNIVGKDFKIIKSVGDFNCVSYTLGIYDGWMWTSTEIWPYNKIPRNSGIYGSKQLYRLHGYEECESNLYERGFEKIAFYSKNGEPIHASKQFGKMCSSCKEKNTWIDSIRLMGGYKKQNGKIGVGIKGKMRLLKDSKSFSDDMFIC